MKKLLIIFFLALYGCPGAINVISEVELTNNYIYVGNDLDMPIIKKKNKESLYVPPIVKDYKFNDNYIIIKQVQYSLTEEEKKEYFFDYYDLIMEKGELKYWIIFVKSDSIVGPLDNEKFLSISKEHNISLSFEE